MSDMRDRVKDAYDEFDSALMGLRNAFGYVDDPAEWADDPEEHADVWQQAASAARNVECAADELAEAARRVARSLDGER